MTEASGRGGFTGISNRLIAEVQRGRLTVAQLGIATILASECNYIRPTTTTIDGREVTVEVGEVLFSTRKFSERNRVKRDAVLRCVRTLARLGWIERRKAYEAAPPSAPPPAPGAAPPPAPPPTIIRFMRDRALMWPGSEAVPPPAPPSAPPGAPPPAPIQHVQHGEPGEHLTRKQPATSDEDCGEVSRKKPARLTATQRRVIAKMEKRIGRSLFLPSNKDKPDQRRQVLDELTDWVRECGDETVIGQAEAFARSKARHGYDVFALQLLLQARDEVERFSPGDRPDIKDIEEPWLSILEPLSPWETMSFWREQAHINKLPNPECEMALRQAREKWTKIAQKRRQTASA